MVDVEKRCFAKPFRMMHNDTRTIKQRFFEAHLPRMKEIAGDSVIVKHPLPRQSKRSVSTFLPPVGRSTSFASPTPNAALIRTNIETAATPTPPPSAAHEAAQRFILRHNLAKFSHDASSVHVIHGVYPRRSTLYSHIQAKIDTGLPRAESKESPESNSHQLEPIRPVNWSRLKRDIEQDIYIRAHSKRIQFNSGVMYTTQLTALGNLVRSKIKSHLSSATGSGDQRYKIVVQLTVFPAIAAGLHVASRCLWNPQTDNSITIKMQGVDCDILMIAFLCYTDLGEM